MMTTDQVGKAYRILVTGVGGAPGFDLTRKLMTLGCEVIGTDAHPLASGLLLPKVTARVTAGASDPRYGSALLQLCRELRPDALIPTVERELPQLIALRDALDDLGVRTWLPPLRAVDACIDKAQFHTVLAAHDIPTPRTFLPNEIGDIPDGCPLVVKPRRGQGSQQVVFCRTREQARILCELIPEPIVQERIQGQEFTADCLVDRSGRASVILRHRLLTKGGLSMVSRTFHDAEVTDRVRATLAAVGATGLCCTQGFLREDAAERIVMTEMNARIAGGFPLSEAAGADLVGQTLNGLFGLPVDHSRLGYRAGIRLTKYVDTLAIEECPHPDSALSPLLDPALAPAAASPGRSAR
jgi:carbamoyl-phosphate synthase large subunit